MEENVAIKQEFTTLIEEAKRVSEDVGQQVEEILRTGINQPLSREDACRLLTDVINVLKRNAEKRKDHATTKALQDDVQDIVKRISSVRERIKSSSDSAAQSGKRVLLQARHGIAVTPVQPKPVFHGMQVAMDSGFLKTTDIKLWDRNDRLDIHLGQFRQKYGRSPNSEEVLQIMLGDMSLPGVTLGDEFEIQELARSIAINGVRRPPIVDIDGTLLDGNRRVTACYYILNSNQFTTEQKSRVEWIHVHQLTIYATAEERDAVVVSLNFESDCKQKWPEYVKARKIHSAWQTMLTLEPSGPGPDRIKDMKRELSVKFALGTKINDVSRYLKMVEVAEEFEAYHQEDKGRDEYEVKHKANQYFQYFDELSKGTGPGGVQNTLSQHEPFKHLVFELLYQDKFKNWNLIRNLKHYNQDVYDALLKVKDEADPEKAEDQVETILTEARNQSREVRTVQADTRIQNFVGWLEALPISAFRDDIRPDNLQKLLDALELVKNQIAAVKVQRAG